MSMFFGAQVLPGKAVPIVPRPLAEDEGDELLRLTQACVPATVPLPAGTRVSLYLKVEDGPPLCVATMAVGNCDTVALDVALDSYAELSVEGAKKAEVHVSGYYAPMQGGPESDEEDGDDDLRVPSEEYLQALLEGVEDTEQAPTLVPLVMGEAPNTNREGLQGGDDDDEDSDEDDDDEDEDEDDDGDEPRANGKTKHTVIEEMDDDEEDDEDDDDDDEDDEEGPGMDDDDEEDEDGEDDDEDDEDEGDEEEEDDEEEDDEAEDPLDNAKCAFDKIKALPDLTDEQMQKLAKRMEETKKRKAEVTPREETKRPKNSQTFTNGFEVHRVKDSANPTAKQAKPGKRVVVKYRGTLKSNGKVFDQTKAGKTFAFRLGVGEVIKGWDKGIAGMRCGDKRKLVVPPEMAYGSTGVKGAIPPNAFLCFDVELVDVR